jgi:hypothetical protein
MGQGFSLSDENLNKLYDGTAEKNDSVSITQGGWTITVKNLGPKPNQEMTHQLYSMTTMVNGSQVGKLREITLCLRGEENDKAREENDKANMRNKINREMKKLQDAMSEAAGNTSSSSTNLKL